MSSVVYLYLLLFSNGLIGIYCYDVLSNLEGGRRYRDQVYYSSLKENFLSCESEKECICRKEHGANVFHCENEFNVRLDLAEGTTGDLEITCNVTMESKKLERDYYSIMEMEKALEVNLHLINCPEPPRSYPSLFFPQDHKGATNPSIYKLNIDCGLRKQFAFEEKHFEELIFMDWRNMFPKLQKLDLSHNKIEFLTHQDLLFTSAFIMENGTSIPYPCHHSLILDLQFNQIKKLELPMEMLIQLPKDHDMKLYGHVTINMDNNPFYCGCGIINFLRLLDGDVALINELRRTEGIEWILSANIHVGNLSCWLPETVRGKKLVEPQTWMYHIFPTLGVCSLLETE
ncbi:hypothetical protein J437_LFUL003647 [Ladona fulva]|uniref:Uncharacterized protein n=1 Tax=Ladona fulva TaxID=123851 RepID=A0A8K0K5D9_LADFU|nr:hypothetical protein J437_LFUL003647 [Ladona fulva]